MLTESSRWLTVDPGEDTGWALWRGAELLESGTTKLHEFTVHLYDSLVQPDGIISRLRPFAGASLVVCEDWALYPWKLQHLQWDKCRTARGIGAITFICYVSGTPIELQPASIKTRAVAGGAEVLFESPLHENRHANDAKMHGVYYWQVEHLGKRDQHDR